MLNVSMSDGKINIKKWIYISSSESATKFVISPLELKTVAYIDLVLSGGEITRLNYFLPSDMKIKKIKEKIT